MEYRKLTELKELPNNPRLIKDRQFKILCESIQNNPEYFEARPIILSDRTGELVIIAGNQRYKAAKHLKLKEVPTYLMENLTEEKEHEIIIRDNVSNGEWDFEQLSSIWDAEILTEWGVDIPNWEGEEIDYSDKNKEIDTDEFSDNMTLKFEYNQNEYTYITENLNRINPNKELALLKLLNYES